MPRKRKIHIDPGNFGRLTACGRRTWGQPNAIYVALKWDYIVQGLEAEPEDFIYPQDKLYEKDLCKACMKLSPDFKAWKAARRKDLLLQEVKLLVPRFESYVSQLSPSAAARQMLSDLRDLTKDLP